MVEHRPMLTVITHIVLISGVIMIALPIWITFVAASHDEVRMTQAPIPMMPGSHFWENFKRTLFGSGLSGNEITPVWWMLLNSLVMALSIATGKIAISLLSAFAIVYFKFPFRMGFFWMIFLTLMLPVEVRILPTFEVVANLGLLNSYWGLSIPLIASATATFMFRQVFLTISDEMLESARIDGAGPMRFFWDILLPLSRTNIAALFVILFIYGWNQYLWPLLITTD
ncbi:MAG TPA: sn-glycerol-3-phosphate ABC transporter permease UgpE, partial [Rhodobacteraceae bacterium]|nr:sn-glycerol-3-phosphate ABC transporter permease UgpE [Paracoccaceae bacterium]